MFGSFLNYLLGEYKGLTDQEIQYVEKYQRLQTTEIQLENVRALI